MRRKNELIILILLAVICGISAVCTVCAISTADAKEPIDTAHKCSLTLTYAIDGEKTEGLDIEVFQAATVTSDYQYSMTGAFSDYPVRINGIKSQSEWDEVKDTCTAYIAADKIAPTAVLTTDTDGVVQFTDLPVGIYYVRWTQNETVDQVSGFAPFMIAVPGLGDDGKWIYDVDALPKPGMKPEPSENRLTLVKLWRDGKHASERPQTISADIIRNGELFRSVELTEEQNWTYTWDTEGTYTWTAVERSVPDGYTVTVCSESGNTIQIINTRPDDPTPPPQTGDTGNIYFWMVLMALSGVALIIICGRRRKAYEE